MSENEDDQLPELRRDIAELMGRCILKLQNYELGLKRFLATSEIRINTKESSTNLSQRRQLYSGMTLGQLIKEFTGSYVTAFAPDSAVGETDSDKVEALPSTEAAVQIRFSVELSSDDYASLVESLSALVNLRNEIVHHFLSKHSLLDQADCLSAKKYLTETLNLIDHHTEKLNEFFKRRAEAERSLRQLIESGDLHHHIEYGFIPGRPIDWPQARAVELLRLAESQFQINGWTELLNAIDLIKLKAPELSPKSYGCSSWRELLHTSSLFEIRKQRSADHPSKTLYRSR